MQQCSLLVSGVFFQKVLYFRVDKLKYKTWFELLLFSVCPGIGPKLATFGHTKLKAENKLSFILFSGVGSVSLYFLSGIFKHRVLVSNEMEFLIVVSSITCFCQLNLFFGRKREVVCSLVRPFYPLVNMIGVV